MVIKAGDIKKIAVAVAMDKLAREIKKNIIAKTIKVARNENNNIILPSILNRLVKFLKIIENKIIEKIDLIRIICPRGNSELKSFIIASFRGKNDNPEINNKIVLKL